MPWHAESLFTPGPRRPLTLGERALWLARLHAARLARAITAAHAELARALLRRLGPDGRLDPGYACLAVDTGLSERTVGRAIRALAEAGLLTWQRRLRRDGWRAAQTSNGYALVPAGGAPLPPPRQYQPCAVNPREFLKSGSMDNLSAAAAQPSPQEQEAAQIALAEVRRQMEARALARLHAFSGRPKPCHGPTER